MNKTKGHWAGLSFLFMAVFLVLPSGVDAWFDGLPFSRRAEVLAVSLALPSLLLLGGKFLRFKWVALALAGLALLKLGLALWAPLSGLNVLVYESPAKLASGQWERTYESFWRPGVSQILDRPWGRVHDFPIEWLNRHTAKAPRKEARPVVRLQGWVSAPPGAGLVIAASGLQEGRAVWRGPNGKTGQVPIAKSLAQAGVMPVAKLPQGRFYLEAILTYGSAWNWNWSLIPCLVGPGAGARPAFGQGVLWRNEAGARLAPARAWRYPAQAGSLAFLGLLLAWAVWTGHRLWTAKVLGWDLPAVCLFCLAAWKLQLMAGCLASMALPRAVAGGLVLLGVRALARERRGNSWRPVLGRVAALAVGPAIFASYLGIWWPDAGSMQFWDEGHDWLTYQNFARQMVLSGDWLESDIGVWTYQPLYRYLVALAHLLGGQSALLQKMLDVWAVIGGGALAVALGARLGLRAGFALFAGWLYFSHLLADRFVFLVAAGLQEYAAMLAMMLAAWAAAGAAAQGRGPGASGGFAFLGQLLRQDHLGGLAGLGLFRLPPALGGLGEAWKGLWLEAWRRRAWLAGFLVFLLLALLLVGLRNYHMGGRFTLMSSGNLEHLATSTWERIWPSLDFVLSGDNRRFMISALVLWGGFLTGLAGLVLRFGPLRQYPLQLGLVLLAIVLPYCLAMANAYPPRFSVHLLPFACLSLAALAQGIWDHAPARRLLGGN